MNILIRRVNLNREKCFVDADDIVAPHKFYVMNRTGLMYPVDSEAEAIRLVDEAHAGKGWKWFLVIEPEK